MPEALTVAVHPPEETESIQYIVVPVGLGVISRVKGELLIVTGCLMSRHFTLHGAEPVRWTVRTAG